MYQPVQYSPEDTPSSFIEQERQIKQEIDSGQGRIPANKRSLSSATYNKVSKTSLGIMLNRIRTYQTDLIFGQNNDASGVQVKISNKRGLAKTAGTEKQLYSTGQLLALAEAFETRSQRPNLAQHPVILQNVQLDLDLSDTGLEPQWDGDPTLTPEQKQKIRRYLFTPELTQRRNADTININMGNGNTRDATAFSRLPSSQDVERARVAREKLDYHTRVEENNRGRLNWDENAYQQKLDVLQYLVDTTENGTLDARIPVDVPQSFERVVNDMLKSKSWMTKVNTHKQQQAHQHGMQQPSAPPSYSDRATTWTNTGQGGGRRDSASDLSAAQAAKQARVQQMTKERKLAEQARLRNQGRGEGQTITGQS